MLKKRKKSVLITWTGSYIIILLIPIITIFINFHYNARLIEKEIIHSNELMLNNLKISIDKYLENELSFYNYIYSNVSFENVMLNGEKSSRFYTDIAHLKDDLATYNNYNSEISCLLYFINKNYALNVNGATESNHFYQAIDFYNKGMPDYDEWKNLVTAKYNNEFIINKFLHHKTMEECIVYADTLAYYRDNPVNLFISIPVSEIITLTEALGANSQLLIAVNNRTLLAISNGRILENPEPSDIISSDTFYENDQYIGLQCSSAISDVSYHIRIPQKEFWQEARYTRNILSISIGITLFMSAICMMLLLRHNFQPLSSLLSKMGRKENTGNEFTQIEELYNDLLSKNRSMHERILSQEETVRKNTLLAMLKGRNIDTPKGTNITLNADEEVALVSFEVPMSDEYLIQHDEILHFALDNIFSELMEEEHFQRTEDGRFLYYLFFIPKALKDTWKQKCIEKANFLCELFEDKWNLTLTAALSGYESELERIRFLYQDIMEAFEYKNIIGATGLIDTTILKDTILPFSVHSSVGTEIENALEKRNLNRMLEILNHFCESSRKIPFPMCQMQILEIFQTAARSFFDFEVSEERRMYLLGYLKPLLDATNVNDSKELLDNALTYVYKALHDEKKNGYINIVESVKEYIEAHYADSTLNISTIANSIGRNPKYISKVFKDETQDGILDYINMTRINKAKILLRSGKYSAEDVGSKVGYASRKSFYRAFTKITGITPGKFAENEKGAKS